MELLIGHHHRLLILRQCAEPCSDLAPIPPVGKSVFAQGFELIPVEVRIAQLDQPEHQADPNEECNLYGEPSIAAKWRDRTVDHNEMFQDKQMLLA